MLKDDIDIKTACLGRLQLLKTIFYVLNQNPGYHAMFFQDPGIFKTIINKVSYIDPQDSRYIDAFLKHSEYFESQDFADLLSSCQGVSYDNIETFIDETGDKISTLPTEEDVLNFIRTGLRISGIDLSFEKLINEIKNI
jgi:hypothetical protein